MKFKVGDRVKCLEKDYTFYGQIGTVKRINDDFIYVSGFISDDLPTSYAWKHFERDLELVEEFSYKRKLIDFIESRDELEDLKILEHYNGDYTILAKPLPKEEVYGLCLDNLSRTQYEQIKNFLNLE